MNNSLTEQGKCKTFTAYQQGSVLREGIPLKMPPVLPGKVDNIRIAPAGKHSCQRKEYDKKEPLQL